MLAAGQGLIARGPSFVMAQRPLDWAHWLLLLGAVSLTWRITEIPLGRVGRVGRLASVAGSAAFVGMSVIDFIFWTLPSEAARHNFGRQVLESPVISFPFLTVGPSLLFLGLGMMVFDWAGFKRVPAAFVFIGIALVGYGQFGQARALVVAGHLLMLTGFAAMWQHIRTGN